jgi:hypothetical protein
MGAEATLTPGQLLVTPGGEATFEASVRNTGGVVDSFTFTPLGPAAPWTACEPAALSLFPGQTGTVRITVRPPVTPDLPEGPVAFAVRVVSNEDPAGSVVEEAMLHIAGVPVVTAELSPRTNRTRGKRASKYRIAVDNRGNVPAVVGFTAVDDEDALNITFLPPELQVAAGSAAFCDVRVRAVRRFWRGPAVTRRFNVAAHPPHGEPIDLPGTLLHEAAIPGWLPKAAALTAAAAVALAVTWFAVLRPVVQDAATAAGTTAAQQELNKALQNSSGGGGGAAGGGSAHPSTTTTTPPTTTSPAKPTIALPPPAAFAKTLSVGGGNQNLTADSKHEFSITDLVLQNPNGDKGNLTVSRNGQVLLSTRLENFRDYDLHFVTAITIPAGDSLSMSVNCQNGGPACSPVALVSGMSDTIAF